MTDTPEGRWPARHYDGRSPEPLEATVRFEPGAVVVSSAGDSRRWPLESIVVVRSGGGGDPVQIERHGEIVEALFVPDRSFYAALRVASRGRKVRRIGGSVVTLRAFLALGFIAIILLFAAWRWGAPALAGVVADNIPPEWERAFGQAVVQSLAPESERVRDATVTQPVRDAFDRLVSALPARRDSFDVIVVRSGVVNAFATPGGHVVVTTGLLRTLPRPDELAAVLAHEVTHVTRRHTTRGLLQRQGVRVLFALLAGDDSVLRMLMGAAGTLSELSYSRNDETEADEGAVELLARAGIAPQAMDRALERLSRDRASSTEPSLEFLSTHPASQGRRARVRRHAEAVIATPGAPLDTVAWSGMRRALAAMPDPAPSR